MKYLKPGSPASVCLAGPVAIGSRTCTVNFGAICQANVVSAAPAPRGNRTRSGFRVPLSVSSCRRKASSLGCFPAAEAEAEGPAAPEPSAPSGLTAISESSSANYLIWSTAPAPVNCFTTSYVVCRDAMRAATTRNSSWLRNRSELERGDRLRSCCDCWSSTPHNAQPILDK